jgi:hypothetical protein
MASEKCNKCNPSSELPDGWDCVCELLMEAGNCPECLNLPEKCACEKTIIHQHWTEHIPANLPDYDDIPRGYVAVVHRHRTVIQRADEPVAFTPGFSSE